MLFRQKRNVCTYATPVFLAMCGRSDETDTHTDAHTRTQTSKQMGFCVAKNRRNLRNGNAHRPWWSVEWSRVCVCARTDFHRREDGGCVVWSREGWRDAWKLEKCVLGNARATRLFVLRGKTRHGEKDCSQTAPGEVWLAGGPAHSHTHTRIQIGNGIIKLDVAPSPFWGCQAGWEDVALMDRCVWVYVSACRLLAVL